MILPSVFRTSAFSRSQDPRRTFGGGYSCAGIDRPRRDVPSHQYSPAVISPDSGYIAVNGSATQCRMNSKNSQSVGQNRAAALPVHPRQRYEHRRAQHQSNGPDHARRQRAHVRALKYSSACAHLISSARCEPSSGPPAFTVRDWQANSLSLARIGPNGPNLCCSAGKLSAYGPYGLSIGFSSRTG